MNQIEIWFSILHRRIIRYGDFGSTDHQKNEVEAFIGHWNKSEAHPFRWTWRTDHIKNRRQTAQWGGHGGSSTGGPGGGAPIGGTGGAPAQSNRFSFSLTPTGLTLPARSSQTASLTINRNAGSATFNDPITFTMELGNSSIPVHNIPAVTFSPNPATEGTTSMSFALPSTGFADGPHDVVIVATSGAETVSVILPFTVTSGVLSCNMSVAQ